jgi:hypothetical protein
MYRIELLSLVRYASKPYRALTLRSPIRSMYMPGTEHGYLVLALCITCLLFAHVSTYVPIGTYYVSCIVSSIEHYGWPDMYRTSCIEPVGTLDPDPYTSYVFFFLFSSFQRSAQRTRSSEYGIADGLMADGPLANTTQQSAIIYHLYNL